MSEFEAIKKRIENHSFWADDACWLMGRVAELQADIDKRCELIVDLTTKLSTAVAAVEMVASQSQICLNNPLFRLPEISCDAIRTALEEIKGQEK